MKLPRLVLEEGPVTPFDTTLSFDEAALAEPLACAINGLELVNMSLGKTVVIIGLGPIGCMMIGPRSGDGCDEGDWYTTQQTPNGNRKIL